MEAERLSDNFPRAILFHSALGKKQTLKTWNKIASAANPVIVVGTPLTLSLPRSDWGTIVLERPLARGYERSSRPYIAVRTMAKALTEALGAELIVGSPLVPVEDAVDCRYPTSKFGLDVGYLQSTSVQIVDMRPDTQAPSSKLQARSQFTLFSPQAKEHISQTLEQGKNVLLITARRGLAPHTTCDDCGTPLSCPRCSSGLVLHEERQPARISLIEAYIKRWFECHYCGLIEKVNILCPICGSWRLSMHGIGLTLVAREAEKLFPKTKLLVADDDIVGKTGAAKKMAAQFSELKGAMLAATESMVAYLGGKGAERHEVSETSLYNLCLPLCVVVSVDSMLYVPEYSAPERTLAFLNELRGLSNELVVQTRVPDNPVIQALAADNLVQHGVLYNYYEHELELRKKYHYPPYTTLIRFSVSGTPEREKIQAEAIMKALEPFKPFRFPARAKRGSIVREHILIRLIKDGWIDQKLLAFIRALPPSVEVRVNPKNVISD